MRIGRAGREDREAVIELLAAQMIEHDIDISRERLGVAVDGVLAADAGRGAFLIARDGEGRAVGVAYLAFTWSIEHGGHTGWLEELYVLPAERERGIGTQLLHAVIAAARELKCAAIDLEVEETHARAARLYAREGFEAHRRARWVLRLK
jgi:GNAT superfamily N-acetyltransferase